jgi:hypothetical protein
MARICNDTGRALEYSVVYKISKFLYANQIKFSCTSRASLDNKRDSVYFKRLPEELAEDFVKCAQIFVLWAKKQGWFKGAISVDIDRLPDTEGVSGDVTDIRLNIKTKSSEYSKNISIKHHHNALKHPRLPRLPEQCGISDRTIKKKYISKHDAIWNSFIKKAHNLNSETAEFSKIKEIQEDFIEKNLYKPLILLVNDFLEKNACNPESIAHFFRFLTGNFNFFTIKNEKNAVLIKHFVDLQKPTKFKIIYPYKSLTTFLMNLDNGWEITFRLHTASSRFIKNGKINMSTKFDVNCINLDKVIKIEKIPKS